MCKKTRISLLYQTSMMELFRKYGYVQENHYAHDRISNNLQRRILNIQCHHRRPLRTPHTLHRLGHRPFHRHHPRLSHGLHPRIPDDNLLQVTVLCAHLLPVRLLHYFRL